PSAKLCCHPVQRDAATFGDHQRVCKSHPRRRRAVGLGRCPVRAQGSNVRFADHPEVILPDEEQAARDSSREAAFTYGVYWKFSAIARELCRACCWTDHNICPSREAARFGAPGDGPSNWSTGVSRCVWKL